MSLLVKVLIVVSLCLLSIFATVYFFFNPLNGPNTTSMDNATIQKLCEESKQAGTITIYTNTAGEVGGYRVYDSNMDGGTSKYYNADGSFIGEWGIIPLDNPQQKDFAKQIANFPIKNTVSCNS